MNQVFGNLLASCLRIILGFWAVLSKRRNYENLDDEPREEENIQSEIHITIEGENQDVRFKRRTVACLVIIVVFCAAISVSIAVTEAELLCKPKHNYGGKERKY